MEFLLGESKDDLRVLGLLSDAGPGCPIVVHIHGYGGDFCSNPFVRQSHDLFPKLGISFLSVQLRSSGYLSEDYNDKRVIYTGSAVIDHDAVELDIDAALDSLRVPLGDVVLQGHSFGTNVVKRYARTHAEIERIVLLSPADSVGLYKRWRSLASQRSLEESASPVDPSLIRWDLFGIATAGTDYPIPITQAALDRLLAAEVFREWSVGVEPTTQAALVVQGEADTIGRFGTTHKEEFLRSALPNSAMVSVRAAGHGFNGYEADLCASIARWVLG